VDADVTIYYVACWEQNYGMMFVWGLWEGSLFTCLRFHAKTEFIIFWIVKSNFQIPLPLALTPENETPKIQDPETDPNPEVGEIHLRRWGRIRLRR
jgi:hypothetical protein